MYLNQTFNNVRDDLSRETLNLNGLTSFYDSVYTIIDRMLAIFLNNRQSPPIVIIITDGDDTSSKYVAQEQLVTQINIAKNYGWQFIFFGMTDRSMIVGRHLNFNTCVQYSSDSLVKIPFLIESLINQRVPTTDLDIRGLEQTFQKMDLN